MLLGVVVIAGAAGGCSGQGLPSGAACALLAPGDVARSLGGDASQGRSTTSDSGPAGAVGCTYTDGTAAVTVWLLRQGSAAIYARMAAARAHGTRRPTTLAHIGGFVETTSDGMSQAAFLLDRGYYLNVNIVRQDDGLPPAVIDQLTATAAGNLK